MRAGAARVSRSTCAVRILVGGYTAFRALHHGMFIQSGRVLVTDRQVSVAQAREEALAGFREQGPGHKNCAQAIVHFTMRSMGRDPGLAVAARFMGGGMARMGHTCGALSGAALSFGLRDLTAPEGAESDAGDVTALLQQLITDFDKEFAAVSCLGLTGHDLSTREGYKAFAKSDARPRCATYVEWVIDRISDNL